MGTLTRHIIDGVNGMGASCKGICLEFEPTRIPNARKYQEGLKRCSWCDIWFKTEEIRCPCCRMILRVKARGSRTKKMEVSQVA